MLKKASDKAAEKTVEKTSDKASEKTAEKTSDKSSEKVTENTAEKVNTDRACNKTEELSEKTGKGKKMLMIGALIVLLAIAFSLKTGGNLLAVVTEDMLKKQEVVVGNLAWEKVNVGMAGDVEIKDLSWRLPNGKLKAEVPTITLSYDFWKVLRHGAGIQAVTGVVLDRPHFYGIYKEGESLDLVKGIKKAGISLVQEDRFAAEKKIDPTAFRGLLEIKDGKADLDINGSKQELRKVNIQSAFKFYPLIKTDITAKLAKSDIVLNMVQDKGDYRIAGEVKDMEAGNLLLMYPDLDRIEINAGTVPALDIKGNRDGSGWHVKLKGSAENIMGKACGMNFTKGEADFYLTREEAVLNSFKCNIKDHPLFIKGTVKGMRVQGEAPEFDLTFKAVNYPLSSVSKGMSADGATVNINGEWKGSTLEPRIKGVFSGDYINVSPLKLTGISGNFARRADGLFEVSEVKAAAAGGDVSAEGVVDLAKGDFRLKLHGWGIDTAQMTANTLTGLTDFNCLAEGEDREESATTEGAFRVRGGRWYYVEEGLNKDDTVRYFTGNIAGEKGVFAVKDAQMKLGRVKYGVDFAKADDGTLRVVILRRISSSLF